MLRYTNLQNPYSLASPLHLATSYIHVDISIHESILPKVCLQFKDIHPVLRSYGIASRSRLTMGFLSLQLCLIDDALYAESIYAELRIE